MYGLIWRIIPGHWTIKLLVSLLLIAVAVYLLMQYVFPEVAPYMPFNDATIEEGEGG